MPRKPPTPRQARRQEILKGVIFVLLAVLVAWMLFIKGPRAENATLVEQSAARTQAAEPTAPKELRADAQTKAATRRAFAKVSASDIKARISADARAAGVRVNKVQQLTVSGAPTPDEGQMFIVTVSGSPSKLTRMAERLSGAVSTTKSGQLRASGRFYVVSGLQSTGTRTARMTVRVPALPAGG